ncbi:hypothetical protein FB45DRAFT_1033898 [Roridomyces roridus]|uniref:C2 domain-containing protein n=1 Tax=Roridomyces roridus TaxID=1738132 RepID=A0AAD7BET7_9AGAR|nr:hypothetical protein FB45DRAFT_1033898 [Roridomyces roridus]
MSMKTYSLLIQSADQLSWKPRPGFSPHFCVKVTGCSPELNTKMVSSLKPQWNYESKIYPTATQLSFQLLHQGLFSTKHVCQGTIDIQDFLQKSNTEHVAQLSLSNSENKNMGRLWITLTDDRKSSQSPAPVSTGTPNQPETWRQDIGKKVKQTWQGLHQISKIIASFLPAPFKTPLEIFNTISDVAAEYIENKEALEDALVKLSVQLAEVEGVLLESDKYNIDIAVSSKELAEWVNPK